MEQYKYFHHASYGWTELMPNIPDSCREKFGNLSAVSGEDGKGGSVAYMRQGEGVYLLRSTTKSGVRFLHGAFGAASELNGYAADVLPSARMTFADKPAPDANGEIPANLPPISVRLSFGNEYKNVARGETADVLLFVIDAVLSGKSVLFRLNDTSKTDQFLRAALHFFPENYANRIAFCSEVNSINGSLSKEVQWLVGYIGDNTDDIGGEFTVVDQRKTIGRDRLSTEYMRLCRECSDRGTDLYTFASKTAGAFINGTFDEALGESLARDLLFDTLQGEEKADYGCKKAEEGLSEGQSGCRLSAYLVAALTQTGEGEAKLRKRFLDLFGNRDRCARVLAETRDNTGLADVIAADMEPVFSTDARVAAIESGSPDGTEEDVRSFTALLNLFVCADDRSEIRSAAAAQLLELCKVENHVGDRFEERMTELISGMEERSDKLAATAFFAASWVDPLPAAADAADRRGANVLGLLDGGPFEKILLWLEICPLVNDVAGSNYTMPEKAAEALVDNLDDLKVIELCGRDHAFALAPEVCLKSKLFGRLLRVTAEKATIDNYEEYKSAIDFNGLFDSGNAFAESSSLAKEARDAVERCKRAGELDEGYIAARCAFLFKKYETLPDSVKRRVTDGCRNGSRAEEASDVGSILASRDAREKKQNVANVMAGTAGKNKIASSTLKSAPVYRIINVALMGLLCFVIAVLIMLVPVFIRSGLSFGLDIKASAASYLTLWHLLYPCAAYLIYVISQRVTYVTLLRGYTNERGAYKSSALYALWWCLCIAIVPGVLFDLGWIIFYFAM